MAKLKLTTAEKKARAAEYARKYRERRKAGASPRKAREETTKEKQIEASPDVALQMMIRDAQRRIHERAETMMMETVDKRLADAPGMSVAEIMATFSTAAGQDEQSEALIRLLAALRQAERFRTAVLAGDFAAVIGRPAVAEKKTAGKRKRA